jgi:hypothetical protein
MVGAKASGFFYSQDTNLFANAAFTLIKLLAKVCAANCFFDLRNPFVAANVLWLRFSSCLFCRLLKDSILLPQWLSLHGFNSIYRSARRTAPPKPQSFCTSL